jgi:hypothetical protein
MKYLLLFLLSTPVFADEQARALEYVKQAVLQIPQVKSIQRYSTQKIYTTIPYSKEMAVPLTIVGIELTKGKIGTKVFKTNFSVIGGTVNPESVYDLKTYEFKNVLTIKWAF